MLTDRNMEYIRSCQRNRDDPNRAITSRNYWGRVLETYTDTLVTTVDELKAELRDLRAAHADTVETLDSLNSRLTSGELQDEIYQETTRVLREERDDARYALKERQIQIKGLENTNKKLRHWISERDDRITRLEEVNANQRVTIGQRDKTIGGLQASYSSLWDTYTRVVANHDDLAEALNNERNALQAQREAFRLLAETYDDLVARLDEKANTDQVSPRDGIKIPVRCGGGFASFAPLYQEKKHGG